MISAFRSSQAIAIALALLAAGGALAAGPPASWSLSMPSMAASALRPALERSPDDVELHAQLGMAMAQMGFYADALPCFVFALGAESYGRQGLALHADTLHALGRPAEAAALRRERLAQPLSDLSELLARVGLVDDLRALGDPAAEDAAWDAIAAFPASSTAWSALAETLIDRGDLVGAFTALALPTPPRVSARVWQARARLALAEGDPFGAEETLLAGLAQNQFSQAIAEDLALLRLDQGDPEGALELLNMIRFGATERPRWLRAEVRARAAVGELALACERLRRLRALYPGEAPNLAGCEAP